MSDLTVTQDLNMVTIGGEKYSLSVAPDFKTALVQKEVKNILGQLSLSDITEHLYLSVELFYVAYNGVAGAREGKLQAEISQLQSKLALLCNECIITMTTFDDETKAIISNLVQTYSWLTRGNEKMAITKLSHCAKASTTMSSKAQHLADQFKELQVNSTVVRSNTIEEETSQRDRQLAAQKAQADMVTKQKAQEANQRELVSGISEMQQSYDEAKQREEEAGKKALAVSITSAICGALGSGLAAFAAVKNPIGTVTRQLSASGTDDNPEVAKAQKETTEKQKRSTEAQMKLTTAKDEQTAKKTAIATLETEVTTLNKSISEKEKDAATKDEDLKKLKSDRDAKQKELDAAKKELKEVDATVKDVEKVAKDRTAEYTAAAKAFQSIATSMDKMAASAINAEESIHKEKMKFLDQKLAMEKEKRESLVALAEYAESIKNLKVEEGSAELSVNSLHAAVEALGKIIGSLTNASLFWKQMAEYCKRMTESGLQQTVKDLADPENGLSKEERIAEYRQQYFMSEFLTYLCQWVALNGLSAEYQVAAGEAQKKAVDYIKQSPTIEEAIRKAPELAKNLQAIVSRSLQSSREASTGLEQQKALGEASGKPKTLAA